TETVAPPLMNPLYGVKNNDGIGKPIISAKVKLINDSKEEVIEGETGQIIIKGEPGRTIMKGYFKNEEATNEMIREGWLYTGDKAVIKDNYFYFVDRNKDMIKRSGENVSTIEVENVLAENEAIYEAAVIGVDDEIRDEAIKAFIILKDNKKVRKEDIFTYCRKRMAKFKVPDEIVFVEDFPRTSVGKIQKHKLE